MRPEAMKIYEKWRDRILTNMKVLASAVENDNPRLAFCALADIQHMTDSPPTSPGGLMCCAIFGVEKVRDAILGLVADNPGLIAPDGAEHQEWIEAMFRCGFEPFEEFVNGG